MLDSEAVFLSRAADIGLNSDEQSRLKVLNISTCGRFAFGANYVPGHPNDRPLLDSLAKICQQDPVPEDRVPMLRPLNFTSHTMLTFEPA